MTGCPNLGNLGKNGILVTDGLHFHDILEMTAGFTLKPLALTASAEIIHTAAF